MEHVAGRDKQDALFVIDSLEELVPGSSLGDIVQARAEPVSELLPWLPKLTILVASRERLDRQGEWMCELHGLPLPPDEYVKRSGDYSAAGQSRS